MSETAGVKFDRLVEIMRRLRGPDGCAWDRKQTIASLRPYVLEETYELIEAMEHGQPDALREELGDCLLECVFVAEIGAETGAFDIGQAIDAICDKLVRRHPHVFDHDAGAPDLTSDEVRAQWETLKARERAAAGAADAEPATTLSGIPRTLPSLLRAYKIGARAAAVGFDWARATDVLAKIEEEVAELRLEVESIAKGATERAEDEMGDVLFALANLSRKLGIEPEAALRRANEKFTRRFEAVERRLLARGRAWSDASLEELEAEWQAVKRHQVPSAAD